MKKFIKITAATLCFVGMGFVTASADSSSDQTQSETGLAPTAPFIPMVWVGAGWYYGHWYDDEATYNNDVDVNREYNQYNNEWNHEDDQDLRNNRAQWDDSRAVRNGGYTGRQARGGRGDRGR